LTIHILTGSQNVASPAQYHVNDCSHNKDKIINERRTHYSQNKENRREYYLQNKENITQNNRDYYSQNKEKIAQRRKENYCRNKEKIAQQRQETLSTLQGNNTGQASRGN
jgi:hypothetical protein